MKTIDSPELYDFFRNFRFALNGDTGSENFMLRKGKAHQVYKEAVAYIDEQASVVDADFDGTECFDDAVCFTGGIVMAEKMATQRAKGYDGWSDPVACPTERLQRMLVECVAKGDPVDVMVIANMLRHRGERTAPAPEANFDHNLMKTGDEKKLSWSNDSGLPG